MKQVRVYISGPMTGYEDLNFPAFNKMAEKIRAISDNILVINPVVISEIVNKFNEDPSYIDFLKADFKYLLDCDCVIRLDNWKNSGGCRKEITLANYIDIPCFDSIEELKKYLGDKKWL